MGITKVAKFVRARSWNRPNLSIKYNNLKEGKAIAIKIIAMKSDQTILNLNR
jgi:hypothetical protein